MLHNDNPLYVVPGNIQTRWASGENPKGEKGKGGQKNAGRKGAPCCSLEPGQQLILAEVIGTSGTIRRIWATIAEKTPALLRGLRLDFYWDGASKPAVSVPFGDFFGHGLGRMATFQSILFTSPEGRSFNCYIPMPFKTGMKVVITNESKETLSAFYYDIDYTIGDSHDDTVLYFHACFNRQNPTTLCKDFEILPRMQGKGRYIGANIGVRMNKDYYFNSWWGEGEVKVYLDGDTDYPTLCGTGTEDYIGTGWGQGQYAHLYQGCPTADLDKGIYCFYRYHIADPIYFHQDIMVAIQQLGCWDPHSKMHLHWRGRELFKGGEPQVPLDFSRDGGSEPYGLYEREDDWSSCAYFYLDKPENSLPALEAYEKRAADL
jgi:hypothetical protein